MKKKKVSYRTGDIFAVPLEDGSYGLGYVVDENDDEPFCAFFANRTKTPTDLLINLDDDLKHPLTILEITSNALQDGIWPILANKITDFSNYNIPTDGKGKSHTSGIGESFLNAYHGFTYWDEMYDPKYFEKKLISRVPLPSSIRFKSNIDEGKNLEENKPYENGESIDGPSEIEINIIIDSAIPSKEDLSVRNRLEQRLEEVGSGEVNGAESGEGIMTIFLETDNASRSIALVNQILIEFGISDSSIIEVLPLTD